METDLAVATADPAAPGEAPPYTYFPVTASGGWHTTAVRLTGLTGRIRAIGVRLRGAGGAVRWRLGGLAVREGATTPAEPTGFRVTGASGGDLRLAWDAPYDAVRHHELHRVLPDGTRRFLGGTCQRAFFVRGKLPEQGESAARFELRAVGELYTSSAPATAGHPW